MLRGGRCGAGSEIDLPTITWLLNPAEPWDTERSHLSLVTVHTDCLFFFESLREGHLPGPPW